MKNVSIMYSGSMYPQKLLVADDAAAELERQTQEGYEVPLRVVDYGKDEHSIVLVRPSAIASLRITSVTDADQVSPVNAQALADRVRELGLRNAWRVQDRVPAEMGALLDRDLSDALAGRPIPASARRKIAAALDMPEDWLL